MDTVTQRLNRLERENRWWRVIACAAVGMLGFVMLTGATGSKVPDEVRAKKFIALDEEGKSRAEFGATSLKLGIRNDNNGSIYLSAKPRGVASLYFKDEDGRLRASLGQMFGFLSLNFYDKDGKNIVYLGESFGTVRFSLLSPGKSDNPSGMSTEINSLGAIMKLSSLKGIAKLAIHGDTGLAWLGNTAGPPTLHLRAKFSAGIAELGPKSLRLQGGGSEAILGHTTLETIRTGVVESRPVSSLVLFKDGKAIWSAP